MRDHQEEISIKRGRQSDRIRAKRLRLLEQINQYRHKLVKISKEPDIVVTPGGRHVWVNTNAGRIRKPVSFVGVTNSLN